MIEPTQLRSVIGGDGFGADEIILLKGQPDSDLVDLIHQLRAGTATEVLNAKRDYVIALLNARGADKMLRLTWWIATLTWVLVGVGFVQIIDILLCYSGR